MSWFRGISHRTQMRTMSGMSDDEINAMHDDFFETEIDDGLDDDDCDGHFDDLESIREQAAQAELEARMKQIETDNANRTLYPRAHAPIENLDVIEDIARENLLNPLYESTLREFDEAKAAMSRAAHKLAAAVKLTDSDEIARRTEKPEEFQVTASSILASLRKKTLK